jgi:rare lipoprotein A (peptidoglycan hydrolase)
MWRGVVRGGGALLVAGSILLAGCATTKRPPVPARRAARPPAPSTVAPNYPTQEGLASWYGPGFQGRLTSSREVYDQYDFTAAHRTLPLGTWALVTNTENGRTVKVYVNDRGPYIDGRVIDLSFAAAYALDMVDTGTAPVRIVVLGHDAPKKRRASLGLR